MAEQEVSFLTVIKRLALAFAVVASLLAPCLAVQDELQVIGPFGGLDTNDNPAVVPSNQAQDLLNVDVTPGGKSVKKREGLALDYTFVTTTSPVHGAYRFFDSSGNEVKLWGQDNGIWGSVSGGATVRLATGTVGATWQCADYLGFAYCASSGRDTPVKTGGTAATTTFQSTIPAGTMVAVTADRLLVSGVSGQAQRIYYSGSLNFTDFTLGTLVTSSSYEDITSPGSAITHISYHWGRWMWWKDASFGYIIGTDQTNLNIITVADNLGTFDNSEAYDQGICYFRGNDNQLYYYNGSSYQRLSLLVRPTADSANRRKFGSWTQTTQADFSAGAKIPYLNISSTIVSGQIEVSSFGVTENSAASGWTSGTSSNFAIGTSSLSLTRADGNIPNNGFESGAITNWTLGGGSQDVAITAVNCTLSPRSGTKMLGTDTAACATDYNIYVSLWDCSSNVGYSTTTIAQANNSCTWASRTLSSSGLAGKSVKVNVSYGGGSGNCATITNVAASDCFINSGTDMTFYTASDRTRTAAPILQAFEIDDVTSGSDTVTSGYFTSQAFDTGFASSTAQLQMTWNVNTTTPTVSLQHSAASGGPFVAILTSTGTNAVVNRYVKYSSTFTLTYGVNALSAITSASVVARSTGTYYSAVNNAGALTAWGTLTENDTTVGNSTITYYVRASSGQFTILSSTPAWTLQVKNATPNYSTGTYMQLRADFAVTAATENPSIQDFTFNWFEGNAADKMYATYFNYAVWFAVSLGTTTTVNNRILRYDLMNQGWTMYDIGSNGFLTYSNSLYIGDPSTGKTYKFGGVNSDNGTAINSYWKSKDFFGKEPWTDDDLRTASWYCKTSSGTTLSVGYTINQSTTTTYTINLYDPNSNIIRHNRNFPLGTRSNVTSFKIGDNSTNPSWECFAGQYTFMPQPWNVYP